MVNKFFEVFVIAVIGLGLILGLSLLFTYPLMWLINYTLSATFLTFVFGTAQISFWKTFAVSILIGLLRPSNTKSKD